MLQHWGCSALCAWYVGLLQLEDAQSTKCARYLRPKLPTSTRTDLCSCETPRHREGWSPAGLCPAQIVAFTAGDLPVTPSQDFPSVGEGAGFPPPGACCWMGHRRWSGAKLCSWVGWLEAEHARALLPCCTTVMSPG